MFKRKMLNKSWLSLLQHNDLADVLFIKNGEGERIRQIFGLAPISALLNTMMAIIAAKSFYGTVPNPWIATWFVLSVGISAIFLHNKRKFDPTRISRVSAGWRRTMMWTAFGFSLIWAPVPVGAIIFLEGNNYLTAMLMCIVLMTGAVIGMGSVPMAAIVSAFTASVPTLVTSFITYGPLNEIFISFLLFLIVLTIFAIKHSQMIWEIENRGRQVKRSLHKLAKANESIRELADTDQLTGLMNRRSFMRALEQKVADPPSDPDLGHMCLIVDLDHFKNINDAMGHDAGDVYLQNIADKLMQNLGDDCCLARLGGDEFAVVSNTPITKSQANAMGQKVCDILEHEGRLSGHRFSGGGSVGGALHPIDASGVYDWLNHADHALREAKATKRGSYRIFNRADRKALDQRGELILQLSRAIDAGEIRTVYQPQVDIHTGLVCGVETLARWSTRNGTPISPPDFLELAETSGRVLDLADRIFDRAIYDLQVLADRNLRLPSFSINLHPAQLHHAERLYPLVDRLAAAQGGTDRVVLEITEDCIIGRGAENVPRVLEELSLRGFKISLDDFGTGFASLTHLQNLPISELKIDRSFVRKIEHAPEDQEIIRALLMIAEPRGLNVVLEGIETEAQRMILTGLGAEIAQGYLFAKPLEFETLCEFVQQQGSVEMDQQQLVRAVAGE